MKRNVGGLDRQLRLVAGSLLLVVAIVVGLDLVDLGLDGTVELVVVAALAIAGTILLVTGLTQKCPTNRLLGIDTLRRSP